MRNIRPAFALAGMALSFVLGVACAGGAGPAVAALAPLVAQRIDLLAIPQSAMGAPARGAYTKVLVDEPGGWLALQSGTAPKHYHLDSDEMQYFIAGTGTEWFQNKLVTVKPGVLLIIPKKTQHGLIAPAPGQTLKWISFKLPPPVPGDVHLIP